MKPLGVGGGGDELGHGVDAGGVVAFAGRDAADRFRVDGQRRRDRFGERAGNEIDGEQWVGTGGEHAGEVGVIRVGHEVVELDPEEALAGISRAIDIVVVKWRESDSGGGDLWRLRGWNCDG